MTVNVECPSCGKSYNVANASIGARAKCKNCGDTFTLSVSLDDTSNSSSQQASVGRESQRATGNRSAICKSSAGQAQGPWAATELSAMDDAEQMPKKLGHFVVQRKLGAGAMGVVYLARDPILDRQVAIKVLPAAMSSDEERLQRFLREAKSAARLHHTNVAAVHQAGAEGRLVYIVMEYVEGVSLDKTVAENGEMAWRFATRTVRDAATGLGAAHAIGLVHRDIKPANLIRTKDGVTKVVDFGLVRGQQTDTQLTQLGTLLGTPAYMAPEQWTGGMVDGRSDLYSLTCTYYFLLTGHLPFEAPSLPALGYQHRYEAFPDPRLHVPTLPDGVCRILRRGSAKEPSERFQTAEELIAELDTLLACPYQSLAFGSPWKQLDDPAGPDPSPIAAPLPVALVIPPPQAPPQASSLTKPLRPRAVRPKPEVPLWVWIATSVAIALLVLLGAMIVLSTKHGTVRIALRGAEAKDVTITIDGETITFGGLDEPLKVQVGEHNLTARSANSETVTRSFQVKQHEVTTVEVTFEPKIVASTTTSAVFRLNIDPPEAMLTVSGQGVTVAGRGRDRTVYVAEPDGRSKTILLTTLDGYRTLRREFLPVAGETQDLVFQLELIPKDKIGRVATDGEDATPPLTVAPFDGATAKDHQERWAVYLDAPATITNSIGMVITLIPPGEFQMGRPDPSDEGGQRRVRITRPFYLGIFEVTQGDFVRVTGTNPSRVKTSCEWAPVTHVSWSDALEFCRRLSALPEERSEGRTYRLPTDAEWEYACRAGSTTLYCFGDSEKSLGDYAWYNANSDRTSHRVGEKKPNAWGLYDIHGNVEEWCWDWYEEYPSAVADDPTGPAAGLGRVYRGGSWSMRNCESSFRGCGGPNVRMSNIGFRVACDFASASKAAEGAGLKRSKKKPPLTSVAPPAQSGQKALRSNVVSTPPLAVAPFDAATARQHQARWATHLGMPVEITNSIDMTLALIPAGEFLMGSPDGDFDAFADEKPQRRVRIAKPFYLSVTEVTQEQYERTMARRPRPPPKGPPLMSQRPSHFVGDPKRPVDTVSQEDAVEFCRELTKREGRPFRLPTEAEWEYACRAGSTTKWCFGDDETLLKAHAWYDGNSNRASRPVGQKKPNNWGLYDMHGNLSEWCSASSDTTNGGQLAGNVAAGSTETAGRSVWSCRGGTFGHSAKNCRSARGYLVRQRMWATSVGFRVVCSFGGDISETWSED